MKLHTSMKKALLAAGLGLSLLLPSAAWAVPADYDLLSTGEFSMTSQGAGTSQSATRLRSATIRIDGGRIRFDPATGHLTHLRLDVRGHSIHLDGSNFRLASGTIISEGHPVFLRVVSARHPRINFTVRLGVGSISNPGPQVAANPVPEPTAAMLFGAGLLAVGSATRRRD